MANVNLWDRLFHDIDWSSVSDKGRKLSHAARRNLITTSAICATLGSFSAGVGLVGSYHGLPTVTPGLSHVPR